MADVVAEQVFSVDVELADGSKTVLRFEAETSGEAYRQAQNAPNVRRVGRVTVGHRSAVASSSLSSSPSSSRSSPASRSPQPVREQRSPVAQLASTPGLSRDQLLGNVIGGPRVVREARLLGFERPFAKLQAPPRSETPEPTPVEEMKPVALRPSALAIAAAKLASQVAETPKVEAPSKAVTSPSVQPEAKAPAETPNTVPAGEREYRIIKSRRKEGSPYFLQRGVWSQQGSKRIFDSNWEKGFDSREAAEQHQAWAEKMAAEIAELNAANG